MIKMQRRTDHLWCSLKFRLLWEAYLTWGKLCRFPTWPQLTEQYRVFQRVAPACILPTYVQCLVLSW
nr:MAG TPA: hypothetical protein [Caudoviricetes sp.]